MIHNLDELCVLADSLSALMNMKTDKTNPIYKERINIIVDACFNNDVPYEVRPLFDGYQIRFPWCHGDVACHSGTYGCNDGCVETYAFPWDEDDVSVMPPSDAINCIVGYYKAVHAEK